MRTRALSAVAGIALLAVAIALVLLGRAVLATPAAVDRAAPGLPVSLHVGARHRSAAERLAAALLAADRGDAFDEVAAVYAGAIDFPAGAGDPRGPVKITGLIPKLHSPAERAEALTIAGTLLAYSAGAGFGAILPAKAQASTQTVLDQARTDYRAAIREDPSVEAAKYDLELLLRQHEAQSPKRPSDRKQKKSTTTQDKRPKTPRTNGQEHHAGIYQTGTGY